jgi:hypothetical protein
MENFISSFLGMGMLLQSIHIFPNSGPCHMKPMKYEATSAMRMLNGCVAMYWPPMAVRRDMNIRRGKCPLVYIYGMS